MIGSMPNASAGQAAPQQLLLVGYRGTGKTATGIKLAQRLGWQFIDTDHELEREAGQTISAIFATAGEPAFRRLETAVLSKAVQRDQVVVSTGGGIVLLPENRAMLTGVGTVVWLKAQVATIQARLSADRRLNDNRPALLGNDVVDEVAEVLRMRTPWYEAVSHFSVDTDERTQQEVADAIVAWLHVHRPKS